MSRVVESNDAIKYIFGQIDKGNMSDRVASAFILVDIAKSLAVIADEMKKGNKK